jgi:hypothetical protein
MTTYSELVTQIRDYTETDSNVLTTTIINDFIEHAELRIFRQVDSDAFRRYATAPLTFVAGQVPDPFIAKPGQVPTDFSYVRTVSIYSDSGSLGGLTDNERIVLIKKDYSFMTEYWPNRTSTGIPKYYANWDQDTLFVAPTPNAAYTIELAYVAQPTGLSSSTATTWISNNAPAALLYACLIEAFKFLKNPEMMAMYTQAYQGEIQVLASEQMGFRRRDDNRDGVVRMPIPSGNP